jgi:hypothetical protein
LSTRVYFPPVEDAVKVEPKEEADTNPDDVEAAKEIASKLPDVPTSEPGESEHPEKKQKQ